MDLRRPKDQSQEEPLTEFASIVSELSFARIYQNDFASIHGLADFETGDANMARMMSSRTG